MYLRESSFAWASPLNDFGRPIGNGGVPPASPGTYGGTPHMSAPETSHNYTVPWVSLWLVVALLFLVVVGLVVALVYLRKENKLLAEDIQQEKDFRKVRVKASGREGIIAEIDNSGMPYKVYFSDGRFPEHDWFERDRVDLVNATKAALASDSFLRGVSEETLDSSLPTHGSAPPEALPPPGSTAVPEERPPPGSAAAPEELPPPGSVAEPDELPPTGNAVDLAPAAPQLEAKEPVRDPAASATEHTTASLDLTPGGTPLAESDAAVMHQISTPRESSPAETRMGASGPTLASAPESLEQDEAF
mmetsp:Transcript_16790/g.31212  ORF Transcript_16790/g.31212 Transcript_16790/m.31212 type:complete len:304 (+) Transcript_16790:116-1027(+)